MASLPANFIIGSASSAMSVRDAIASYRRAQFLVAGSPIVPGAGVLEACDEEEAADRASTKEFDEEDLEAADNIRPHTKPHAGDDVFGQWDDDEFFDPSEQIQPSTPNNRPSIYSPRIQISDYSQPHAPQHERTPLLRHAVPSSTLSHPHRLVPTLKASPKQLFGQTSYQTNGGQKLAPPPLIRRRSSVVSSRSVQHTYGGQSTFGQTLFNSIAILLGVGMLSEPLAFAYAGWTIGTMLIVCYGFIACYTAKILAHVIVEDPRLRSYSDIGRKAFGPRSTIPISMMFCLELFAISVILVTLYADSLHTIIPQYSTATYKVLAIALLIPTVFMPLSLLSYTSILGILSTFLIIAVIIIDGCSKRESPGSFWKPAETSLGVDDWGKLGISFGLFMAGFSGHAVIPSLARDMVDPKEFDRMINWAFIIATFVYTLIGYAGYLMFGKYVSDEISVDLLNTPGFNPILNQAALWMLVVSPLSKFALTTEPLNATVEILLGIDGPSKGSEQRSKGAAPQPTPHRCLKKVLATSQRVFITLLSVAVSILIPEFSSLMAFLGSFSAFMLCVIGPVSVKVMLARKCGLFDGILLASGVVMAGWGTVAAFLYV